MIKTSPAVIPRSTPILVAPQGTHTTQPTIVAAKPRRRPSAGSTTSLNGHAGIDAHVTPAVEGSASQRASEDPAPMSAALAGTDFRSGQSLDGPHLTLAVADLDHPDSQDCCDTHARTAVGAHTSPQAKPASKPILPAPVGFKPQPTAKAPTTSIEHPLSAGHPTP